VHTSLVQIYCQPYEYCTASTPTPIHDCGKQSIDRPAAVLKPVAGAGTRQEASSQSLPCMLLALASLIYITNGNTGTCRCSTVSSDDAITSILLPLDLFYFHLWMPACLVLTKVLFTLQLLHLPFFVIL
jgi:hypothetical protein